MFAILFFISCTVGVSDVFESTLKTVKGIVIPRTKIPGNIAFNIAIAGVIRFIDKRTEVVARLNVFLIGLKELIDSFIYRVGIIGFSLGLVDRKVYLVSNECFYCGVRFGISCVCGLVFRVIKQSESSASKNKKSKC